MAKEAGYAIEYNRENNLMVAAGDTLRMAFVDQELVLNDGRSTGEPGMYLNLNKVTAVSQDEATGSWQCTAEMNDARDPDLGTPIRYISGIASDGEPSVSGTLESGLGQISF
jgi:hypothetical protein